MMMLFMSCFCLLFAGKLSSAWDNHHIITGQVFHVLGSTIGLPRNSYLLVEIDDATVKTPLRTFAVHVSRANVFPVMFNISYVVTNVIYGHTYMINAKIFNEFHELLFQNDKFIEVKLLGRGRTQFIDIPVCSILRTKSIKSDYEPSIKFRAWPDLLGTNGEEAVERIKEETGFTNVFIVTDQTKVTKDLRFDRVLIYVDDDGNVMHVPRTG